MQYLNFYERNLKMPKAKKKVTKKTAAKKVAVKKAPSKKIVAKKTATKKKASIPVPIPSTVSTEVEALKEEIKDLQAQKNDALNELYLEKELSERQARHINVVQQRVQEADNYVSVLTTKNEILFELLVSLAPEFAKKIGSAKAEKQAKSTKS